MSLNPLNELKRRLEDDTIPLPKRLCLAKNVVTSHHFPTAPKESIVADWVEDLTKSGCLDANTLKAVLGWINVEELTSELKGRLIQVAAQFVQKYPLDKKEIQFLCTFIENDKILPQLSQQIDNYLTIVITLLQQLKSDDSIDIGTAQVVLNNLVKVHRECKKKLELITKFLDGKNLETVFGFLCFNTDIVTYVCKHLMFPKNKKSFFVSFLQTLIRKDNIDELMAEKGDNIQTVLKIMTTFFTFPKGRTVKSQKFLSDFIRMFVSCFRDESQLIFAFYIMVVNSLNMSQNYIQPAMKMPPIIFEENDEKIKRNLFLKMIEYLLEFEVDIGVRLPDTFGEKISKVEIKKNFTSFLQAVMIGQLKLEGKLDKLTLQIINTALKLDPLLVEQKMDQILPHIISAKKSSSIIEFYTEMLNSLLEILFKLSRGTIFISQILPNVKLFLEAGNTEQFELKQKIKEAIDTGSDAEKLKSKLITGSDIFPEQCVDMYGKLTSELMFRQNRELLVSLQKDFEEHCLLMLEEGFVSPSIITLTEVLSAILSSFLRHSKMADHTVPKLIAEDFWDVFKKFESECLGKLGKCVLKLSYNSQLSQAFLNLSLNVARLKLLNKKYSHTKLDFDVHTSEVLDLSVLLPCLTSEQWITLAEKVNKDEGVLVLDNLLLVKTMALQLSNLNEDENQEIHSTKDHLAKRLSIDSRVLDQKGLSNVLFADLDNSQAKVLAKNLIKIYLNNPDKDIFKSESVANNRILLNALVMETLRNMTKCFENMEELAKRLGTNDFDFVLYIKGVGIKTYFDQIALKEEETTVLQYINILRQLSLPYLEESYQLVVIFLLLAAKKCCQKKIRKNIDQILLNLFELSPKYPHLFKIFPVDLMFSFEDETLINLLTLKIKISNNMFIIKCVLESAVKKVKTESEIVKKIVELLLSKQKKEKDFSCSEYFSDPVFQITCIILPLIAKEKRAITTSNYRSILADLQEKLHISVLNAFKNIDFGQNSSLFNDPSGNIDESMVVSEAATLNAMAAYSLTLSKYCETTDAEEIKNLDCLWSSLEFFVQNSITTIQNPSAKPQHVDSSIQLLNILLRHIKKLETHTIFNGKDKLFVQIWKAIVARLMVTLGQEKRAVLDDVAVTLKFLCELSSVESFVNNFVGDLNGLQDLKKPKEILQEDDHTTVTSHKVSRFIWTQILKANLLGQKCVALSKLVAKLCKAIRLWMITNYEDMDLKKRKLNNDRSPSGIVHVDDVICDVLRIDLDIISETVLAAKKITLDYKLLDSIFSLQHIIHCIASSKDAHFYNNSVNYGISEQSLFKLFEGCIGVLNSLLVSREELLEDRWPNYMQCYRALWTCLCSVARADIEVDRSTEDKLSEIAHSVEKLTQSICKRKTHVSRIAAYTVGDICSLIELTVPRKPVRQHLENSAALLLQAAEWNHCAALLKRALAASAGHVTLTSIHTAYKRYHHYTGNS